VRDVGLDPLCEVCGGEEGEFEWGEAGDVEEGVEESDQCRVVSEVVCLYLVLFNIAFAAAHLDLLFNFFVISQMREHETFP